jgi:hypothetical protein
MNFSPITDDLFIGTTPSANDYDRLRELGVRLVINMRFEYRPRIDLHADPIRSLWLPTFDYPLLPIPIKACAGGRHRGVAMGAAILIAQGYDPHAAMTLIKERRQIADPFAFYIRPRILKFARQWDV